ncbi:MAG TPA: EamA family transporter [Nanoarchaeota archaeon]|nr:EamA family transporter [Nanoarchaeota archaeon]
MYFFDSLKDLIIKKGLKEIDEYTLAFSTRFFALFLFFPFLLIYKIPEIKQEFWLALFVSGSINILTTILYIKALKYSELSLAKPITTFTPLFLLITSPLIVGEMPSFLGFCGVILIVLGAYILNIKQIKENFLAPIKALFKEKGVKLMFIVAFLWSISSNFDKIGVTSSSPIFWIFSIHLFISICLFPFAYTKVFRNGLKKSVKIIIPLGFISGISLLCQMIALKLTLVVYVISIKRMSSVISVIFGYLFLNEKNIKERLLGALIMVIGAVCIVFS